jgi:hypothetical protein
LKLNKSLTVLALVVSAGLGLTACGSSKDVTAAADATKSDAPVTAPSAAPIEKTTPSPTPDAKKSVRGNLIGKIGSIGTISDPVSKAVWTKFTVDAIAPVTCDQPYAQPAKNGQLVTVNLTVETTPELAQSSYPKFTLSSYDFKFIADNGTTFTGNLGSGSTYSCIASAEQFPSAGMGPAEKLSGKVVLDLPAAHGILVMNQGLNGGFEYTF